MSRRRRLKEKRRNAEKLFGSAFPRFSFNLMLLAFLASTSSRAFAAPDCPELPCSVMRNCSSTGVACEPADRACAESARGRDLEVKCEQQCSDGQRLIYCPPDTGRSDSRVVWMLLSLAVVLAVAGSSVLWLVMRKKPTV
jgi:hypothetical protein